MPCVCNSTSMEYQNLTYSVAELYLSPEICYSILWNRNLFRIVSRSRKCCNKNQPLIPKNKEKREEERNPACNDFYTMLHDNNLIIVILCSVEEGAMPSRL